MQEQMGPPHGPLGLIEAPFYVVWSDYLLILFVFLVIVLLGLGFYIHWLKAKRQVKGPAPEELRWNALFLDADRLETQLQQGTWDSQAFVFQLSSLLKQGLSAAFGLPAPSQTLAELQRSLGDETRLQPSLREELLTFFAWAEAAQFSPDGNTHRDRAGEWLRRVRACLEQWRGIVR